MDSKREVYSPRAQANLNNDDVESIDEEGMDAGRRSVIKVGPPEEEKVQSSPAEKEFNTNSKLVGYTADVVDPK
jgi:hypothetical protein